MVRLEGVYLFLVDNGGTTITYDYSSELTTTTTTSFETSNSTIPIIPTATITETTAQID